MLLHLCGLPRRLSSPPFPLFSHLSTLLVVLPRSCFDGTSRKRLKRYTWHTASVKRPPSSFASLPLLHLSSLPFVFSRTLGPAQYIISTRAAIRQAWMMRWKLTADRKERRKREKKTVGERKGRYKARLRQKLVLIIYWRRSCVFKCTWPTSKYLILIMLLPPCLPPSSITHQHLVPIYSIHN